MQFINYFLASIISFLGLLIGIFLIKIAPEEQKPLNKHFKLIRKAVLVLLFLFLIFYYSGSASYAIPLALYFILIFFIEYKMDNLSKSSMITCTALGIVFYLSSKNLNLFALESSLIMLYGIATASLLYNKKEGNSLLIFMRNIGFILVANLAYFL